MALPATTSGWRTRAERRLGSGTRSGSSAARGLRGGLAATVGGGGTGTGPGRLAARRPSPSWGGSELTRPLPL